MKNIFITLVALLFFSCSHVEKGNNNSVALTSEKSNALAEITVPANETLDKLGASLILCLKNNDFEKFASFLPIKEDVEEIATQYQGPEEKKKQLLQNMEGTVKKIKIYSKTGFDEVYNGAIIANVIWNDVQFNHVEYQINKKDNLERASMTIFFDFKNLHYKIGIGECVKSQRGWLVTDKIQWENSN